MKKIYVLALGALLSMSHAQLMVSEKIYQQMDAREKGRSVLMKTNKVKSDESYVYSISSKKKFKSGKNFKVEKLEDSYRITPEKKYRGKKIRSAWSEKEMRVQAMSDIKSLLPKEVADSCSVTSVGFVYEQRDNKGPRTVGSVVMAHRILDGVPVRGSSYIMVDYDSTGNVSYVDIEWDVYNKMPAKSTVDVVKRNKVHRADFEKLVESVSEDLVEKECNGRLDNSVQTLSAIQYENGDVMLVPSVTFIGQYSKNDSDEFLPMTFDIPTDASLVPINKAVVSR